MALHVRGQGSGRVVAAITDGALEWLSMVVCLEVNFEMVASGEGTGAMLALVAFVACMQFDVPVATSFVLEWSITVIASIDCVLIVVKVMMGLVHLVGPERIHAHLLCACEERQRAKEQEK